MGLVNLALSCLAPSYDVLVIKFLPAGPGQSQKGPVVGSSHLGKTPYPAQAAWLQPPTSQQQWRAAGSDEQRGLTVREGGQVKLKEIVQVVYYIFYYIVY